MPSPEEFREILPEETLQIATAIADRSAQGDQFSERVIAELQGTPFVETPIEVKRGAHLGRTVLLMLKVEDPSRPIALRDLIDASMSNGGYEHKAAELSVHDVEIDDDTTIDILIGADSYKQVLTSLIYDLQGESELLSDEKVSKNFERQLEAAREVAESHDTDVAAVYRNDDLYFEANAKAFPAEESVKSYLELIKNTSAELLEKILINMVDKMLPAELAEHLSEEEKSEFIEEFKSDPGIQAMVEAQAGVMQEVIRQVSLYNLVKSHGIDALATLTPYQREAILPKMPLAKEVRKLVGF